MGDDVKERATARTEEALRESSFQDPRGVFRDRLRWLKEQRPAAFAEALSYHENRLLPAIVAGEDPIDAWARYGMRLGELSGRGKIISVDPSGRAWPDETQARSDRLLLYLPDDVSVPALTLAVPRELSDAQAATLELLMPRRS